MSTTLIRRSPVDHPCKGWARVPVPRPEQHDTWRTLYGGGMAIGSSRAIVVLDEEHALKRCRLAGEPIETRARSFRSLLATALEEADPDRLDVIAL